jgi:hypothetical protein
VSITPTHDGVDLILSRLEAGGFKVRRAGSGWQCQCPSHPDREPSLSVREGDNGVPLLHDFGGCRPETILADLGLTWADVLPPRPGRAWDPDRRREFREALGVIVREAGVIAAFAMMIDRLTVPQQDRAIEASNRIREAAARLGVRP